ncbi:MAG TPA: tetratricopeptide repeat protein [Pyrinomonadaceae bacterium]|nr:tetratricopeptide repeat protein [Pyrinomonadaceae bacterium]
MLKRNLLILVLVPTLVLAVQTNHLVHGVVMTPDELATLDETGDTTSDEKSKDGGNGFARALKAPFKAFGRLFGGKKNDSKKLQRITEKDLRKFESVPARAITDNTAGEKTAKSENGAPVVPSVTPVAPSESEYSQHLAKAKELVNAGDMNGAIATLSRAALLDPKAAEVKNLQGIAYEGMGMRKRALESFKAAVQADKNNAEYLNNYGFLLFKNHDNEDALKYLKRAAKLTPNDPRVWNNLGLAQCRRGKFEDAFQSFARAVGEFNGHMNVATQLYASGYAKEAIVHLEKAQSLEPESVEVLARLVSLYAVTGRPSDSEAARRSIMTLTASAANK